jgi:hypothetical protein
VSPFHYNHSSSLLERPHFLSSFCLNQLLATVVIPPLLRKGCLSMAQFLP